MNIIDSFYIAILVFSNSQMFHLPLWIYILRYIFEKILYSKITSKYVEAHAMDP